MYWQMPRPQKSSVNLDLKSSKIVQDGESFRVLPRHGRLIRIQDDAQHLWQVWIKVLSQMKMESINM